MAYLDSKKHYEILDGLRGVAAVFVVAFHLFEIFSGGNHQKVVGENAGSISLSLLSLASWDL